VGLSISCDCQEGWGGECVGWSCGGEEGWSVV